MALSGSRLSAVIIGLIISGCSSFNSQIISNPVINTDNVKASNIISDEVLVRLKSGISGVEYAKSHSLTLVKSIGLNIYLFKGSSDLNLLKRDNNIKWAEPNRQINLEPMITEEAPATITSIKDSFPNDPLLPAQYGITITGTDKAWEVQKGSPSVIVAVIDSGVDGTHPEFQGQLLPGWDFTVNPSVAGGNVDGYGHGTHVAGVIGAKADNGIGIAGIAPGCKILPVRIFDDQGHSSEGVADAAIIWAVDHGAKVINASWGSPLPGEGFQDIVNYALQKDVVFVAAVGNSGNNDPDEVGYPGASKGVIGVAATTDIDTWGSFSTYGDQVDLAAPGKGILSTYPMSKGNGYKIMEGTSMAAPFVTAAVALVRSQFPNLTQQQVKERLEKTAKDVISPGMDPYSGFGRVDIGRAILDTNLK